MRPFLFLGLACALAPSGIVGAATAEQRFSSGDTRVSLIELFTSEGCSSCPPAERWLAALRASPGLWRDFVPLEFHVNYWDELGWPDRFASREFTQREYAHAAAGDSTAVYTPCFIRDGEEWRASEKPPGPATEKAGVLTLVVSGGKTCRVTFASVKPPAGGGLEVHVALLGSGFSSRVTAGENRGETLKHEFVVLAVETRALTLRAREKILEAEFALPASKITDAPRHAVAVWLTRPGGLPPLQATGGWLEPRPAGD